MKKSDKVANIIIITEGVVKINGTIIGEMISDDLVHVNQEVSSSDIELLVANGYRINIS